MANQFRTHNLADEVLNKPKEKRAFLANARSLKPFLDPNASNDDYGQGSPGTLSKLRPKFYSKEYAKLRSVLPTIYNQSLEVNGKGAANRNDDETIIEQSLIYRQMQAMQKASEYERSRQAELAIRRQEIIEERDKTRRMTQAKAKQFEQRLKSVDREINGRPNPHIKGAMRALKLQVSDFSMEDKKRADELLKREQFKVQIAQDARAKYKGIEMFENKNGSKPLKDTPAPIGGIAVSVPVFEEEERDDTSEVSIPNEDGGASSEPKTNKPSGRIAIMGISPQKGVKKISLNHQIQDEQLNQAILEPELVHKLLAKSSASVSPLRSRMASINAQGSQSAQRGYVHAFDRVKQLSEQRAKAAFDKGGAYNRTTEMSDMIFDEMRAAANKSTEQAGALGGREAQGERPETPNRWYQHQKKKLLLRYQKHLLEADLNAREFNLKVSRQRQAKERRVKVLEQKKLMEENGGDKAEEGTTTEANNEPSSEVPEKEKEN